MGNYQGSKWRPWRAVRFYKEEGVDGLTAVGLDVVSINSTFVMSCVLSAESARKDECVGGAGRRGRAKSPAPVPTWGHDHENTISWGTPIE